MAQKDKHEDNRADENTAQTEDTRTEADFDDVDPNEEITPGNIQVPIDDEEKDRQNEVLKKDHIEAGFPANRVPRTDEEKKRMKEADLI